MDAILLDKWNKLQLFLCHGAKIDSICEGFPKAVQVIFIGTSTGADRGEQTWAGERSHSSEELEVLSIKQIETDQMLKSNKC